MGKTIAQTHVLVRQVNATRFAHSELLRSPALSQHPVCALSGPTTGSCKALAGQLQAGGSSPHHIRISRTELLSKGLCPCLIISHTSHVYVQICILTPDNSIQRPPYWRALAETLRFYS